MHTCPFCGMECDCDMDDTGGLPVCPHICDEENYYDDMYYGQDEEDE